MKIAIVHNLPKGGGIRNLKQIIERYKKIDEIELFTIGPLNYVNTTDIKHHFIKIFPLKGFLLYNFWIIFILPFIHKKISKEFDWDKYDFILFTHDYFTKSPYLLRYVKNSKKYYLCQESQREFYESSKFHATSLKEIIIKYLRYPIKWIDQINVNHASKLFCNSKYSKNTLTRIYNKNFKVVYPGVDECFFSPSKKKKENIILCVGGINKTKNQEFLVRALLPILDKYKLVLIGGGKQREISNILSINNNIEIVSNITDLQLRNYYRSAKVTCIVAYKEPFGLSSIESQACGTAVITVKGGGSVETIVNSKTGLISNMNGKEFLTKTRIILKNSTVMGKAARINVLKKWTLEKTLKPFDKYFIR